MREKDILETLEERHEELTKWMIELQAQHDELLMQHKGLLEWARKLEEKYLLLDRKIND